MGPNDERRRRAAEFVPNVEALLRSAGFAGEAVSGHFVGTVYMGRVSKVQLGLNSKAIGTDGDLPGPWWPIYGPSGLLATFRSHLDGLLEDSTLRFGDVAVHFANGLVTHMLITARFTPGEDDQMACLLDG